MISLRHLSLSLLFVISLFFSAAQAETVSDLLNQKNDPTRGNPNAKVTIVEFFDYQCSHCANMSSTMETIVKANDNVRVVYKEFPIRGPLSELAARVALVANKQGKYGEFSHALLAMNQPLTEEIIYNTAKQSGLNMTSLKKEIHSKAINQQLNNTYELAKSLKLYATPTIFIAKTSAKTMGEVASNVGELSPTDLQALVDKAAQS